MVTKENIIDRIMNHPMGGLIVSIILGLGLAALFRRSCEGQQCVIVKSPVVDTNKIYGFDNKCYKYKSEASKCMREK